MGPHDFKSRNIHLENTPDRRIRKLFTDNIETSINGRDLLP
jgi:hypothetical protein